MKIMLREIVALCILGALLLSFAGCADAHNMQKTETICEGLLPPGSETLFDYEPSMDLKCTTEPMPVDAAVMTLYFARTIRESRNSDSWVIYVTGTDEYLYANFPSDAEYLKEDYVPPLADYRNVEGYHIVAEFHGGDQISQLTAKWRPFKPVKYNYSQQITIPAECLTGDSGMLSIQAKAVRECYDERTGKTGYAIGDSLGHVAVLNIKYEVRDGQVWFDLSECKKSHW